MLCQTLRLLYIPPFAPGMKPPLAIISLSVSPKDLTFLYHLDAVNRYEGLHIGLPTDDGISGLRANHFYKQKHI